jgi:uncharacterized membrane protein
MRSGIGEARAIRKAGCAFALVAALCLTGCGPNSADGAAQTDAAAPADAAAPTPPASDPNDAAPASTPGPAAAPQDIDTTGWALPPPFYAAGDEPFWRLDLIDGWFVFKRSGLPEIEAPITPPASRNGADVFDAPPLSISIRPGACEVEAGELGVATALVTLDGVEFSGCAFSGQSASGSAEAAAVIEALPAIDACLAKLGEPALVTSIYPREGGRTALGLRVGNGSLFECAAEAGGNEIAFLDPIEPGAAGPWLASRMRFQREGIGASSDCPDAEDVRMGDTVVGRLLTQRCKF